MKPQWMENGSGIQSLADFWKEKYLQQYIQNGGSKLNLLPGEKKAVRPIFCV